MNPILLPPNASLVNPVAAIRNGMPVSAPLGVVAGSKRTATAIIYCEANFGGIDGKTANGLVRHSERYEILSVIDSEKAGLDAGMVLDEQIQWDSGFPRSRGISGRKPSRCLTILFLAWRPPVACFHCTNGA